ncbi:MAG: hypothetical protein CL832_09760 [Crocinitomicaceae bacterium]|nr:hypothetical protein [Crocinitomicaceae bacterium]|tara:strand:- start:2029 stop:2727 length:699 start_codon:yes stop_codon:yes gene_type:complete
MKKLIIFTFSVLIFSSCVTVSRYSGEIFPSNVTFDKPNFKYINTVTGTSNATFGSYGWDDKKVNGIVNEAKQNLYQQLHLKENQVPTNFTLDFVKVGAPSGQYLVLRQLKAVLTADVFEFSNNGEYADDLNTESKPKPVLRNDLQTTQLGSDVQSVIKKNFVDFNSNVKLKKGMSVLFKTGEKYYRGVVKYKEYEKVNLITIERYDTKTNNWISSEKNNVTIPISLIISYKF